MGIMNMRRGLGFGFWLAVLVGAAASFECVLAYGDGEAAADAAAVEESRRDEPRPQSGEAPPQQQQEEEGKGWLNMLERGRDNIDSRMQRLTRALDRVFASDESVELSTEQTKLTGGLVCVIAEAGEIRLEPVFNLKLSLPQTQDRFELFVDNITDDMLPGKDRVIEDENPVQLGVRHYLLKESRRMLRLDAGMSWKGGPEAFLRMHLFSLAWDLGSWTARFGQALFWKSYKREGFGIAGKADFDRFLTDDLLFRYTTAAHLSETSQGMEWEESLMLRWDVVPDRCSVLGRSSVFFYDLRGVSNVRADVSVRRKVFTDWLFFKVTPRVDFPEEEDYAITPSLHIGMEAVF